MKFLLREDLLKHCNDLGTILREGENSDIYPFEFYEELQILKSTSLENINDAKQLMQYILENNFHEIYRNLYITIRMMLTIPVSTASAERSFSKLKLIKTYLRSTMSQESLSALSVLSIEAEIAAGVTYDTILKRFSETKSRKVRLFKFVFVRVIFDFEIDISTNSFLSSDFVNKSKNGLKKHFF